MISPVDDKTLQSRCSLASKACFGAQWEMPARLLFLYAKNCSHITLDPKGVKSVREIKRLKGRLDEEIDRLIHIVQRSKKNSSGLKSFLNSLDDLFQEYLLDLDASTFQNAYVFRDDKLSERANCLTLKPIRAKSHIAGVVDINFYQWMYVFIKDQKLTRWHIKLSDFISCARKRGIVIPSASADKLRKSIHIPDGLVLTYIHQQARNEGWENRN